MCVLSHIYGTINICLWLFKMKLCLVMLLLQEPQLVLCLIIPQICQLCAFIPLTGLMMTCLLARWEVKDLPVTHATPTFSIYMSSSADWLQQAR